MTGTQPLWSVFTKPWGELPAAELGPLVRSLGATAVELPVRPGCAVTPDTVERELPRYAEELGRHGVTIASLAVDPSEPVLRAAASVGVALVRAMPRIEGDYAAGIRRWQQHFSDLAPMVERYGVAIGLQPHHGPYVTNALAMRELLDPLPVCNFGLIWDAGHEGLAGQDPCTSLDATYDRILLVNLKNAVREPVSVTDDLGTRGGFRHVWVDGAEGYADWAVILEHLAERGWVGPICLCAEYTGPVADVAARTAADLALARSLFH